MKNKQIEEIVKIICQYRTDDGKCTCNQYQFGVRKCADLCVYRDRAEQLVDAGYAPVVHGEWILEDADERGYIYKCTACETRFMTKIKTTPGKHCPECGAKNERRK